MIIFPAIDIFKGNAVRLYKGDYDNMTIYSNKPWEIAEKFEQSRATHIHLVDLEGAKSGETPNIETVKKIVSSTGLFAEIGGGIRNMQTIEKYLSVGVSRVILGTAAIRDEKFLLEAIKEYGNKVAVGADARDGYIAVNGWTENTTIPLFDFFEKMESFGLSNIICTDISKDGAMSGTNLEMYQSLSKKFSVNITASGGVSSIEDVKMLRKYNLYGAIIGKAYYLGAIDLTEAIREAK